MNQTRFSLTTRAKTSLPVMRFAAVRCVAVGVAAAALAACGQKGALVLPPATSAPAPATSASQPAAVPAVR